LSFTPSGVDIMGRAEELPTGFSVVNVQPLGTRREDVSLSRRRVEVRVVLRRRRTPTVGDSWPSSEEERVEDVLELRLGSST
jgi:hypothetical protein